MGHLLRKLPAPLARMLPTSVSTFKKALEELSDTCASMIYDSVVDNCFAFRHRSQLLEEHNHMLFTDARVLGKPICSRLFGRRLFRVEGIMDEARFTGGVPVGRDPLDMRFDHCGSAMLLIVNLAHGSVPSSADDDSLSDPDGDPHR